MTDDRVAGRRVVHVTTTDISLALLLKPQLRAMREAGMEVIGASAAGPWVGELEECGIHHVDVAHAKRSITPGHDVLALGELLRLFRRLRPDIVHTHNPKPGVYGRMAARLAGVPVVINTVHGLYATPDDRPLRRGAVYGIERLASTCSDAELVVNEEDAAVLERWRVPRRKVQVLGSGVDLDRFRPRPDDAGPVRRSMGVDEHQIVIGMVGRLVWEKGFAELFEAASRLRRSRPEVVVVVVGPTDPAKSDGLRQRDLDRARAEANVVFLGERRDVDRLYPGFDIFVLPSHREGLPLSAMEAAACGLPVVATDIRGCRQVADDGRTGIVVPVRDPAALERALTSLADDPALRRAMGHAGRVRAEAEFDERRVVSRVLDTYGRLLGARLGQRSPAVDA